MIQIKQFTFNAYQENTYILYDQTNEALIIDPGCYTAAEQKTLKTFISQNELKVVWLLNTHCHIDHVLGNRFVVDTYGVPFAAHKTELEYLKEVPNYAPMMGFRYDESPMPTHFLDHNDVITFGNESRLEVLFTPGHSAGSISFYSKKQGFLVSGDVLFAGSIGRTDLPGANYETLMDSIRTKILTLPSQTVVYSGHYEPTTVGQERQTNPYLQNVNL